MSLTDTELLRIQAIERKLNELQTASNNLASRKELKNLLALLERTISEIRTDLTQIEETGSGSALANHKIDPSAHEQLNERYYLKTEHLATSTGVADAGKPIKLSASGVLDSTLLPGGSLSDHGALGGLTDDDHPQYYNLDRLEAWAASDDMIQSGISLVHDRGHEMDSVADHIPAVSTNWGKFVRANPTTGAIEFAYPTEPTTTEAFSIDINPTTGVDEASPRIITNQAEAINHGPFATMAGATRALPIRVRHSITYQLSDGVHTPVDNLAFGDMSHIQFGIGDINSFPAGRGRITIRAASGYQRVAGTNAMQVGATSSDTVFLATNPGYATNQWAGYFLRCIAGSGSGQVKALRSHDGTSWKVAGRFSPGLTTTSVVEIVQAAASINLGPTFGATFNGVFQAESQQLEVLYLNEIDIVGAEFASLSMVDSSVNLQGCRFTKCELDLTRSRATLHNAILDGHGIVGGFGLIYVGGGIVRGQSSSSSWVVRRSSKHGIYCGGTNQDSLWVGEVDLFEGSVQENAGHGIVLEGPDVAMHNATRLRGNGNSGYGVRMLRGAQYYVRTSDFPLSGDYLTGNQGDINMDDVAISYQSLANEVDKVLAGKFGSILDGNQPLVP